MLKEYIQLQCILNDFLNTLSEEQLASLIEKKAKLVFENSSDQPKSKSPTREQKVKTIDVSSICEQLDLSIDREAAKKLLTGLAKTSLKEVATYYSIPIPSKDTIAIIIEKIIDSVVGTKLRTETINKIGLK
jgi:hypothetical protein